MFDIGRNTFAFPCRLCICHFSPIQTVNNFSSFLNLFGISSAILPFLHMPFNWRIVFSFHIPIKLTIQVCNDWNEFVYAFTGIQRITVHHIKMDKECIFHSFIVFYVDTLNSLLSFPLFALPIANWIVHQSHYRSIKIKDLNPGKQAYQTIEIEVHRTNPVKRWSHSIVFQLINQERDRRLSPFIQLSFSHSCSFWAPVSHNFPLTSSSSSSSIWCKQ